MNHLRRFIARLRWPFDWHDLELYGGIGLVSAGGEIALGPGRGLLIGGVFLTLWAFIPGLRAIRGQ